GAGGVAGEATLPVADELEAGPGGPENVEGVGAVDVVQGDLKFADLGELVGRLPAGHNPAGLGAAIGVGDPVVAGAAEDQGLAGPAVDGVVGEAAAEGVVAGVAVDEGAEG